MLKELQSVQFDILLVIDKICKEQKIDYSLYAGTLLGAVRHSGFIPWDDDLDICMTRENYKRFIDVWNQENPKGYILQNKENTPAFTCSFTKIRKDHTTYLQLESERGRYHTGIFVDIFPIDRMPNGKINRLLFYWRCMKYQLFTREFAPPNENIFIKTISKTILFFNPPKKRQKLRNKLLTYITSNNSNVNNECVAIETVSTIMQPLSKDFLENYTDMEFEGITFPVSTQWKSYLKTKYGDYMRLPPKEEQIWKHNHLLIDFNRNIDEL